MRDFIIARNDKVGRIQSYWHAYYFAQLPSTQQFLLNHPPTISPIVCRAWAQTAGVGQRNAVWHSPEGQLYFSIRYPFSLPSALQLGLAQITALTIAEFLAANHCPIKLKWPNDLFIENRKCGGILIDLIPRAAGCDAVIGVGLNIVRQADCPAHYAYLADYCRLAGDFYEQLLDKLFAMLTLWQQKPYLPAAHRWADYDFFIHKICRLENEPQAFRLLGIDQKGRLIAKDEQQHIHFFTNTRIQQCIS